MLITSKGDSRSKSDVVTLLTAIEQKYNKKHWESEWIREKDNVEFAITQLTDALRSFRFLECTAIGGSRIVLKFEESIRQREGSSSLSSNLYALKICRPFPEAIILTINEFANIRMLPPHQNIIKVIWSRDIVLPGKRKGDNDQKKDLNILPVSLEEFMPNSRNLEEWLIEQLDIEKLDKAKYSEQILNTTKKLADLLIVVINGMKHLHHNLVFHCDIKPENILIADNCNWSRLCRMRWDS